LREVCSIGDERNAKLLIEQGISINAANAMNCWTPLHWVAKRGHASIGADTTLPTKTGESAAQLSSDTSLSRSFFVQLKTSLKDIHTECKVMMFVLR